MEIAIPVAGDAAATPTTTTEAEYDRPLGTQVNEYCHTAEGTENPDPQPMHKAAMYKAATEGDWAEAERLLEIHEDLGWVKISEDGARAPHLAVSGKHTEFLRKLIKKVGWEMLELLDGDENTACHLAVMDGNVELVRLMIEGNSLVANTTNRYGATPFGLAIYYGNTEMASFFLRKFEIKNFTEVKWFKVLVFTIRSRMLDVALKILETNGELVELKDDDNRTALHVLAQLDISSGDDGGRQTEFDLLASKLWDGILRLGKNKMLRLMKKPPILHDAARVGNLNLVKMITFGYPVLLSHIDRDGNSIFHIILMHRKNNMLEFVKRAMCFENSNKILRDRNGNNLLHFAALSRHRNGVKISAQQDVQLQREFDWFKAAKSTLAPICVEMRNNNGYTPIEMFWNEHAELLATGEANMKKTAESCMLISTIVLTLVFAAAFAPPGGFDQDTGIPELLKKKAFTIFIIFQALALSTSTFSIIRFWSIISFDHEQGQFFVAKRSLRLTMSVLLLSVLFVISSFLSAFFLVFVQERKVLLVSVMLLLYLGLVGAIFYEIFKLFEVRIKSSLHQFKNWLLDKLTVQMCGTPIQEHGSLVGKEEEGRVEGRSSEREKERPKRNCSRPSADYV